MPDQLKDPLKPLLTGTNQRRKTIWQEAAKRMLQAEMALRGYGYKQLAREMGGAETDQNLMTRINRGTFSLAFFLQALRTMGTDTITLNHLPRANVRAGLTKKPPGEGG